MKNRLYKLIPFALVIAAVAYAIVPTTAPKPTQIVAATVADDARHIPRVTFHNTNPGPLTLALVEKYAGTKVVVQQQHFVRKSQIAKVVDGEWVFLEDKLRATLLQLKPVFENSWNWRQPQWHTLMLDSEPVNELYGSRRIRVLQDALGLCHQIMGTTVQVGFYSLPPHKGLGNGRPPVHFLDSILAQQGAIFLTCNFSNSGPKWFEKGMRQTQSLLDWIAPIRGDRPVTAYVWPRQWSVAGFGIIPEDKLFEHLQLLIDNDVEISVANFGNDAEGAHLIELARSVVLDSIQRESAQEALGQMGTRR